MPRKHQPPAFLAAMVSADTYERWLEGKARAHVRRDKGRGRNAVRSIYKELIHSAVRASGGRDTYTGDKLDWSLIGKWDNDSSSRDKHKYKAKFSLLPTVDHVVASEHGTPFVICSWQTNDAKNDLSLADFLLLCRKVLKHAQRKKMKRGG